MHLYLLPQLKILQHSICCQALEVSDMATYEAIRASGILILLNPAYQCNKIKVSVFSSCFAFGNNDSSSDPLLLG